MIVIDSGTLSVYYVGTAWVLWEADSRVINMYDAYYEGLLEPKPEEGQGRKWDWAVGDVEL